MSTVHDVAAAILERTGPTSTMKLQKLAYYTKAWHVVWDDEELFPENFEAWANGPVCRALYEEHRGTYSVARWPLGNPAALRQNEIETIEAVVKVYGSMPAHELSALTHREAPWVDAREGLTPGQRSSRPITLEAMSEYYSGLDEGAVDLD
jgi:uncharacterized phage-associated protein